MNLFNLYLTTVVCYLMCLPDSFGQLPLPRHLEEVSYSPLYGSLVLFGGSAYDQGAWKEPSEVAEWNGKGWTFHKLSGPDHRRAHAMVYDPLLKMTLIIGGVMETADGKNVEKLDVWGWSRKGWTQLDMNCPVREPEAAYDFSNNQVLVYGHTGDNRSYELWSFRNSAWHKLSGEGPVQDGPYEVIYHKARKSFIIPVDNQGKLALQEWKNNKWELLTVGESAPSSRNRFGLAYHEKDTAIYLFGGRNGNELFLNDLWKWSKKGWEQIIFREGPSGRAAALLEYGDGRLILFGGTVRIPGTPEATGLSNEIWYYQNETWNKVSGQPIQLK